MVNNLKDISVRIRLTGMSKNFAASFKIKISLNVVQNLIPVSFKQVSK